MNALNQANLKAFLYTNIKAINEMASPHTLKIIWIMEKISAEKSMIIIVFNSVVLPFTVLTAL
jgi:hypothetical protein